MGEVIDERMGEGGWQTQRGGVVKKESNTINTSGIRMSVETTGRMREDC